MHFRIGSVYRNKATSVCFIAVQKSINHNNVIRFFLVNVVNWIVLEEMEGKLMADGEISCPSLMTENYECVSKTLKNYYAPKEKK